MGLKVLGIAASPRAGGNSDVLLHAALGAAAESGAATSLVQLRNAHIAPCVECNNCQRTGECCVQDDYQEIFLSLLETDHVIFSTPIFFMTVSAQAKLLIDRCQCLWSRKYVLHAPVVEPPRDRRGLVIAVGGSKSKRMFDCVQWTMKYWFDVLDMQYAANLFVNKVDAKGDVERHPSAMAEARRLGAALVREPKWPAGKPVNVELFGE